MRPCAAAQVTHSWSCPYPCPWQVTPATDVMGVSVVYGEMLAPKCKATCKLGLECRHQYPLGVVFCRQAPHHSLRLLATANLFLVTSVTSLPGFWHPTLFRKVYPSGRPGLIVYFPWQVRKYQHSKLDREKHMNGWWLETFHSFKFCWFQGSLFRDNATRCY